MNKPSDRIVSDPQETVIANDMNADNDDSSSDALVNPPENNQNPDLNRLSSSQALALFQQNPVGFIQQIVVTLAVSSWVYRFAALGRFRNTVPNYQVEMQPDKQEDDGWNKEHVVGKEPA